MDTTVLPHLLMRLGSGGADELRRQLEADLHDLRQTLGQALALPDLPLISRQAHILVALAAMAGGLTLTRRARDLLRAAHLGNTTAAVTLAADMLPGIDSLVDFVASCPLPAGTGA